VRSLRRVATLRFVGRSRTTVLTEMVALGYPSRPALFFLGAALKHAISIASYLQGMGNTPDLVGRESVVYK